MDKERMFSLFNEMIETMDFELYWDYSLEALDNNELVKVLKLYDVQGANLGKIEDDEFYSIQNVIDRLDIYLKDYYESDLCEYLDIDYDDWSNYKELVAIAKTKSNWKNYDYTINTLQMVIEAENFEPFNSDNVESALKNLNLHQEHLGYSKEMRELRNIM